MRQIVGIPIRFRGLLRGLKYHFQPSREDLKTINGVSQDFLRLYFSSLNLRILLNVPALSPILQCDFEDLSNTLSNDAIFRKMFCSFGLMSHSLAQSLHCKRHNANRMLRL